MARKSVMTAGQVNEDTLEDADRDTMVQVEESNDEDKIRFDTAGSERMVITEAGAVEIAGNLYVKDAAGLYTDKIRRYSDSDNTTKILLNDELIKLYGGHSSENICAIGQNNSVGADNNFWVSGSAGSHGTSARGTAVFGGDLVVSGTLYSVSGTRIDTPTELHALMIDPVLDTVSFFKEGTPGVDTNWFVSGSIGGSINHACFGGDLVVSGGLAVESLVGIGIASPRTALDVVYDYHNSTFENQLEDGQGGGRVIKYSPGADDTLTAGRIYFLHTDGTWNEADANAVGNGGSQLLGVGLGSARVLGVLLEGFVRIPSTEILNVPGSGAVDGLPVYLSTTDGHFDFTAPSAGGKFVRVVGYAIDDDSGDVMVYFNPSSTWVEL